MMTSYVSAASFTHLHAHYSNNSEDSSFFHKLNSCKSIKELKQIHTSIVKTSPSLRIQQILYTKITSLSASILQFTDFSYIYTLLVRLPVPDISVYNDIIKYLSGSRSKKSSSIALVLYCELVEKGLFGDNYTYPFVLKACAQLCALREGEMVHAHVIKNGYVMDLYVVNTLMRLYGVCGRIGDVRKLFDKSPHWDLVSWTTLIQGYVDTGLWQEGVKVFFDTCEAGYRADEKMMAVVISACAKLGDLSLGRKLHEHIRNQGVNVDVYVGNSLVDMYSKCGDIESAHKVFNQMPVRNVVSWNSIILGLAESGDYEEALRVFRKMRRKGIDPDEVTLVGVLNSCANLGVLEFGKWIHAYVDKNRIEVDGFIGNALIDMYAKCGSIEDALEVFEDIKRKDVYTYTTIIRELAMHGKGEMALKLFSEMCELGIQPNEVTFIGILTACCHSGLVDEGHRHFAEMSKLYNVKPQTEHYGCMVDLLGRAGMINEAAEFVENMPIQPDVLIWGSLLGACWIHGKLDLAERVMEKFVNVEPEEDGAYVLMSNIYAAEKKWSDAFRLRKRMRKGKMKKDPGCSSIELDGVVYEFRCGDKAHSMSKDIYTLLDKMKHNLYYTEQFIDNSVYLQ